MGKHLKIVPAKCAVKIASVGFKVMKRGGGEVSNGLE